MITPVILCGGSGTRLWPLSRKSYPKQFSPLTGDKSLFQASVERFASDNYAAPLIVTSNDFRFIVTEQLDEIGVQADKILIEPHGRDTAPAIVAAALSVYSDNPDGILLVAPSDHVISDDGQFAASISAAVPAAKSGDLVTFGISPDRPETGYGYLELAQKPDGELRPIKLASFVEKPDRKKAETLLADGRYLWNAGIFLFSARDFCEFSTSAFTNNL